MRFSPTISERTAKISIMLRYHDESIIYCTIREYRVQKRGILDMPEKWIKFGSCGGLDAHLLDVILVLRVAALAASFFLRPAKV